MQFEHSLQLVDAPSQFEMALACLESYKHEQKFEEHTCFFGYGNEDEVSAAVSKSLFRLLCVLDLS